VYGTSHIKVSRVCQIGADSGMLLLSAVSNLLEQARVALGTPNQEILLPVAPLIQTEMVSRKFPRFSKEPLHECAYRPDTRTSRGATLSPPPFLHLARAFMLSYYLTRYIYTLVSFNSYSAGSSQMLSVMIHLS
jgi:hypothetical protein